MLNRYHNARKHRRLIMTLPGSERNCGSTSNDVAIGLSAELNGIGRWFALGQRSRIQLIVVVALDEIYKR